jgi:hypothetical protein
MNIQNNDGFTPLMKGNSKIVGNWIRKESLLSKERTNKIS